MCFFSGVAIFCNWNNLMIGAHPHWLDNDLLKKKCAYIIKVKIHVSFGAKPRKKIIFNCSYLISHLKVNEWSRFFIDFIIDWTIILFEILTLYKIALYKISTIFLHQVSVMTIECYSLLFALDYAIDSILNRSSLLHFIVYLTWLPCSMKQQIYCIVKHFYAAAANMLEISTRGICRYYWSALLMHAFQQHLQIMQKNRN